MPNVNIFAYQKNLDLHCISAKEAISQFLGFDRLVNLRRFRMWEFSFMHTHESPELQVNAVLAGSYQILNPNNEGFHVGHIPATQADSNAVFYVKVTTHIADTTDELMSGVNKRLGAVLSGLKRSILWEITVNMHHESRSIVEALLEEKVIATTARDKGLLVNPLFESFEFLSPQIIIGE
jgi:hypothetical protein